MLKTKEDAKKEKDQVVKETEEMDDFELNEDEAALTPEEEALFDTPEENETKSERFKRIAGKRVNVVVKYLNLIGGMADQKSNYDYSKEEIKAMFDHIEKALATAKTQYEDKKVAPFNW